MALGARRADVLGIIFRTGGRLVGAGIIIGLLGSIGAARVLGSKLDLFQVRLADPVSFLGVVALLCAVAMVACYVPARRATKVDPLEALRCE
jgi:putative ABC transport system permease protein